MRTRVSSLVLLVVLSVLGPTVATSEANEDEAAPRPDAVLYELMEEAQFTPDGFRVARSALEGKAGHGSPLCPEALQGYAKKFFKKNFHINVKLNPRCTVVAIGRSQINVQDGSGQINGDFWVVVNSDATNWTDAQELVIMNGAFAGDVQVTDRDGLIIAIRRGSTFTTTWVLPGFPLQLPVTFTFTGKFRLPFTVQHTAVYKNDNGEPVPVLLDERALGAPTVRVEVTFD
jgi:hypothetical protein